MTSSTEDFYRNLQIPVDSKHIRLLRVHAPITGSGSDADPIRCDLSLVDLDSNPSYNALSYTWGVMSFDPDFIICNGVSIQVTKNCFSALYNLRRTLSEFTIWIDAICINQADVEEKTQQIGYMGDIYSKAHATYVWLGDSSESTERVMRCLKHTGYLDIYMADDRGIPGRGLKRKAFKAFLSYLLSRWDFRPSLNPRVERYIGEPQRHQTPHCTMSEIEEFFDSTWITRIWTFQELVLSRSPIVVCGTHHIYWDRLAVSIIFLSSIASPRSLFLWGRLSYTREMHIAKADELNDYASPLLQYSNFCSWVHTIHRLFLYVAWLFFTLFTGLGIIFFGLVNSNLQPYGLGCLATSMSLVTGLIFSRKLRVNPRLPVLSSTDSGVVPIQRTLYAQVIDSLPRRNSTDPRDMSFGLISILEKHSATPGDVPRVNYRLPTHEVFRRLTLYLLSKAPCLNEVFESAVQHTCNNGPSWVPDFSQKFVDLKLRDSAYPSATVKCMARCRPCVDNPNILVVKGYIFDTVTSVGGEGESAATVKTKSMTIWDSYKARVGDKLALIAGVQLPVLLRGDGTHFRIIRFARGKPYDIKRRLKWRMGKENFHDAVWRQHVETKKLEFAQQYNIPKEARGGIKIEDCLDDILLI